MDCNFPNLKDGENSTPYPVNSQPDSLIQTLYLSPIPSAPASGSRLAADSALPTSLPPSSVCLDPSILDLLTYRSTRRSPGRKPHTPSDEWRSGDKRGCWAYLWLGLSE